MRLIAFALSLVGVGGDRKRISLDFEGKLRRRLCGSSQKLQITCQTFEYLEQMIFKIPSETVEKPSNQKF